MNDVNKKTIPIISKIKPKVPVTLCVKYNTPKTIARTIRMERSVLLMFLFIIKVFLVKKIFIKNKA